MDTISEVIKAIVMLMPIMLSFGTAWKWLPPLQKFANEGVIPLINQILGLLVAFGGGAAVAHASFLGDIGHALSGPARILAVTLAMLLSSAFHDKVIKPLTPPSPATKQ